MGCAIELKFNRKGILSGQDSGMEPRRKKDTAWRRRFSVPLPPFLPDILYGGRIFSSTAPHSGQEPERRTTA